MVRSSSGLPCLICDAGHRPVHEAVVDLLLHQGAARAGADFALVQGEHAEAFQGLVEEVIILVADIGEEDVGRLAAQLQRALG